METIARLDRLPADFQFPEVVRDRIRFDPGRRRLVFEGHMSLHDYQSLVGAYPDLSYTKAVEELFQNATPEQERAMAGRARVLVTLGSLGLLGMIVLGFLFRK